MFDISKDNLLKDFIKFPKKNLIIILLLLGFGEWFVSDLIHFAGGSIGFFALCLGGYFYLKNDKPKFNEPNNLDGWINLCNEDLNFFEELEATNELEKQNSKRQKILESILNRCEKEKISCIGPKDYQGCQSALKSFLKAARENDNLELFIVAGASSLLYRFGEVVSQMKADNFAPDVIMHSCIEGKGLTPMAKTTGLSIIEIASILENNKPDIVLTGFDIGANFALTIAGAHYNIPVSHIQGGEVTGSIDESVRHSITKLAHLHFPSTKKSFDRLIDKSFADCEYLLDDSSIFIGFQKSISLICGQCIASRIILNILFFINNR